MWAAGMHAENGLSAGGWGGGTRRLCRRQAGRGPQPAGPDSAEPQPPQAFTDGGPQPLEDPQAGLETPLSQTDGLEPGQEEPGSQAFPFSPHCPQPQEAGLSCLLQTFSPRHWALAHVGHKGANAKT